MWLPTLCNHVSRRYVTITLKRHSPNAPHWAQKYADLTQNVAGRNTLCITFRDLLRLFRDVPRLMRSIKSTVLHTRKDLAVSIVCCHTHHPYCYGALSFRARRHCSHLYDCSRRALPATNTNLKVECSDFPPSRLH